MAECSTKDMGHIAVSIACLEKDMLITRTDVSV